MNAKKSLFVFIGFLVWLAAFGLAFAHASETVGENLQNGLIWFGASLLWGILGVFTARKLNWGRWGKSK
jgi:hypothetical protein